MSWNNVIPAWVLTMDDTQSAVHTASQDGRPLTISHVDTLMESNGVPSHVRDNWIRKWRENDLIR